MGDALGEVLVDLESGDILFENKVIGYAREIKPGRFLHDGFEFTKGSLIIDEVDNFIDLK